MAFLRMFDRSRLAYTSRQQIEVVTRGGGGVGRATIRASRLSACGIPDTTENREPREPPC